MTSSEKFIQAKIVFLYTEIGRGHPGYLDGIKRQFVQTQPTVKTSVTTVFQLSHGLSLSAWKFVRFLYRFGARGGLITALYSKLRSVLGHNSRGGLLLKLLGRDIKKAFSKFTGVIVVAHPLLADILAKQNNVIYQHGEFAVPEEAVPAGCELIFVPDKKAACEFSARGIKDEILCVTGRCIEKHIASAAESAFQERVGRIRNNKSLTAGLFTSGALPGPHIEKLLKAAVSLAKAGHTVCLFTSLSDSFRKKAERFFAASRIDCGQYPDTAKPVCLVHSLDRQSEDAAAADLFPRFDFFVAPAHERVHWSLGLGLPQCLLGPHIGTFAPLNAARVLDQGVGIEISSNRHAGLLADKIAELKQNGELDNMMHRGFIPGELNGFAVCARKLFDYASRANLSCNWN